MFTKCHPVTVLSLYTHRLLCCTVAPKGKRLIPPPLQMGKLRQEGVHDGTRIWPGCPKTKVALRDMVPGVGHRGPQLAGEDTAALRTRAQAKVTQLAGGWEEPHTDLPDAKARTPSQLCGGEGWPSEGARAPKTNEEGCGPMLPCPGAPPHALSLAGQGPSVPPLLHPAPSWSVSRC